MSPERGQDRISFEEIISNAKEIMLRDGYHVPVVIMEIDKKLMGAQIPDMPATHGERLQLMHFLGQAAAKSGRVDQLQEVFLVHEGWMSVATEDKQANMIPSQDPEKKEVLIISAVQIKENKKQSKVLEIFRDSDEKVVSLEEFLPQEKKKDESVEIPLLDAFVQGFQTAFRSKFS